MSTPTSSTSLTLGTLSGVLADGTQYEVTRERQCERCLQWVAASKVAHWSHGKWCRGQDTGTYRVTVVVTARTARGPVDTLHWILPTIGPFHARGSDTSCEAAERIRPTLAMRQAAVLGCLRDFGPQTGEGIADRPGCEMFRGVPRVLG